MVYKIWNGQEQLFDIDFYIKKGEPAKECGKEPGFYSEINVAPYLEGLFKFVAGNPQLSLDEFIKYSEVIDDLRAWLWETHTSNCVVLPEAEKRQIELRLELKDILNDYCKKIWISNNNRLKIKVMKIVPENRRLLTRKEIDDYIYGK